MAKKKAKNKTPNQQHFISPTRFMREKARTLPIDKCYIAPAGWQEAGMANIVITRLRPSGNVAMGAFLVDTFCLGVKDATFDHNMTPLEFEEYLNRYNDRLGVEEISYDEVHNIIYGAIAFAEEGGIAPAKGFETAGYILEEDNDDIPLIEYEFGKDGKHFLITYPGGKDNIYLNTLKNNLGDNFDYVVGADDEYDEYDEYDSRDSLTDDDLKKAFTGYSEWQKESARHPDEEYSYQYPEYPQTLSVKNQFIADELLSPDNFSCLPREVIDRILSLPKDEAAEDISNVVFYAIGQTYKEINAEKIEYVDNSAIMHALILLTELQSEKGLEAVLEVMRQNGEFADYHLGDLTTEMVYYAAYACGQNNIPALEAYMNEPGLYNYFRLQASEALTMIVVNQPHRREEIIEVFRRILNNMTSNLPIQKACDGTFAGLFISNLIDIAAKELIPEIKATFATDCVDKTVAGDCQKVIKEIEHGQDEINKGRYFLPNIYEAYDYLKTVIKKPE